MMRASKFDKILNHPEVKAATAERMIAANAVKEAEANLAKAKEVENEIIVKIYDELFKTLLEPTLPPLPPSPPYRH